MKHIPSEVNTGLQSILTEDHFSPVHCYLILSTHNFFFTKNDLTMHWRVMVLPENWSATRGMFSKERACVLSPKFGLRVKGILASTHSVEHASVHYCKSFKTRFNKISFINIDVFVCCFLNNNKQTCCCNVFNIVK